MFHAEATRDLHIEVPAEADLGDTSQLGKLRLNLYGTSDAASNWQEKLAGDLCKIGCARGIGHPSVFQHEGWSLCVLVHGDDDVTGGQPQDLEWLQKELEKLYEIKTQVLGPGAASQGKVLNRIVSWSRGGWTVEADPRHADLIIEQLGNKSPRGIITAGTAEDVVEMSESAELEGKDMSLFRGLASRANYLAPDRPNLQHTSQEVCRGVSKLTIESIAKMRGIGQYLYGRTRSVWQYPYQDEPGDLDVYVDANCAAWGSHCVETWSKTQVLVAKSVSRGRSDARSKALGALYPRPVASVRRKRRIRTPCRSRRPGRPPRLLRGLQDAARHSLPPALRVVAPGSPFP